MTFLRRDGTLLHRVDDFASSGAAAILGDRYGLFVSEACLPAQGRG
jgi:hypothetical protein